MALKFASGIAQLLPGTIGFGGCIGARLDLLRDPQQLLYCSRVALCRAVSELRQRGLKLADPPAPTFVGDDDLLLDHIA
jgi:hypothetical protein